MTRHPLSNNTRHRIARVFPISTFNKYQIGKSQISPNRLAIFKVTYEIDRENNKTRVSKRAEIDQNTLLTPSVVAEIFHVSSSTILREARGGRIKGYRLGTRYKFPVHCLIEFASRQLSS